MKHSSTLDGPLDGPLASLLAALFVLAFASIAAQGQGIILPRPCVRPEPRCPPPPRVPQQPLKVKSIKISTRINDQVAVTRVEQVFENDTPFVLEDRKSTRLNSSH